MEKIAALLAWLTFIDKQPSPPLWKLPFYIVITLAAIWIAVRS